MPPKSKREVNRTQKKKIPGVTKTEYENLLVNVNRELAEEWSAAISIENKKIILEEKLENLRSDLRDIQECINYDILQEQSEVSNLNNCISSLLETREKTKIYFEAKIQSMEEDCNKSLDFQKTQINDAEITLAILQPFNRQRQEFIAKESELADAERKQIQAHKDCMYNEEKKITIEGERLREEMKDNLNNLTSLFRERTSDAAKRAAMARIEKENQHLMDELANNCEEYINLIKTYKQVQAEEQDARLDLQLTEERLEILNRKMKIVTTGSVRNVTPTRLYFKKSKLKEGETTQTKEKQTIKPEIRDLNKLGYKPNIAHRIEEYEALMEELEMTVLRNLEAQDTVSEWTQISHDEIAEERKDQLFEKRQELIEMLAFRIDKCLKTSTEVTDKVIQPVTPRLRENNFVRVRLTHLDRRDLFRNWRPPKVVSSKILKNEAGLSFLPEVSFSYSK